MPAGWQEKFGPNDIPPFQKVSLFNFDDLFSGDTGTKEKNTIDIDHFIKNVCKPNSIPDDVALAFAMDKNGDINEKIFRSTLEDAKLDEYKKAPNTLCQHEINTYYDKQVKQYPNAITDFKRAEALRNELDIKFDDGTVVTPELLKEVGLLKNQLDGVKVLGNGECTKKLTVKAHKFSKSAVEKLGSAGSKIEVL